MTCKKKAAAVPGIRERTRQAVRTQIALAAEDLFVERGYEATTVGDIAAAVGMSQRSVFRYFATKEEIVLGKFELTADAMLETLRARPAEEPVWESLHRVVDELVAHVEEPRHAELIEPMHRIVFDTPSLLAGYLQKLQQIQAAVVDALLERAEAAGRPYAPDDPAPRALTAAAFGCVVAAQHSWLAAGAREPFAEAIGRAMAGVGPRG